MRLTDNNHSLIQRDEHDKIDPKFGPNHILSLLLSNLVLDDESIRIVLCGCPNTGVDNAYFQFRIRDIRGGAHCLLCTRFPHFAWSLPPWLESTLAGSPCHGSQFQFNTTLPQLPACMTSKPLW